MFSNRFAFAALAVTCITAAAAGGYLASRQNTVPAAVTAEAPIPSSAPVQETEAIVSDTTAKPARPLVAAPAASTSFASGKRAATVAHAAAPASGLETKPANSTAKTSEPLPTLDRTWPSGAANNTPSTPSTGGSNAGSPSPASDTNQQTVRADERTPAERGAGAPAAKLEPPHAPEPPLKTFEELIVSADSVIGLQNETSLTSERARVEDRVEARVTRDVRVGDVVAIPAGVRVIGSVTQVDRGGKFKERARLGIRFHTLVLADGTRLPISTDTIYRQGVAPGNESAAKIGAGAVGGAILGAILGGSKGAVIGATTGAGAGTAAVASSERNAATLHGGEPITVRILQPVTVTIEK